MVDILFLLLFLASLSFIITCLSSKKYRAVPHKLPFFIPFVTLILGISFGYAFAVGLNYELYLWNLMFHFALLFFICFGSLLYLVSFYNKFKNNNFFKGFFISNFVLGLFFIYSMFIPTFINNLIYKLVGQDNPYLSSILNLALLLVVSFLIGVFYGFIKKLK